MVDLLAALFRVDKYALNRRMTASGAHKSSECAGSTYWRSFDCLAWYRR
jgi:hypothetical protein